MSESNHTDGRPKPQAENSEPARVPNVPLSEPAGVAMAAILHLLRLISAELVLHRGVDAQVFEQAARQKLGEFTSPSTKQEAKELGLAFARGLVDQILVQIRAQAELKKRLGPDRGSDDEPSKSPHSTLLH